MSDIERDGTDATGIEARLGELLAGAAADAPATPPLAPTMVAAVRRRRTVRMSALAAILVVGGVGVVTGANALRPVRHESLGPAAPDKTPVPPLVTDPPATEEPYSCPSGTPLAMGVDSRPVAYAGAAVLSLNPCVYAPDDRTDTFCTTAPSSRLEVSVYRNELKYDRGCFVAPAGKQLRFTFKNTSTKFAHNLTILWTAPGRADHMYGTALLKANDSRHLYSATFTTPAFEAGDYKLFCKVHAGMLTQLHVVNAT